MFLIKSFLQIISKLRMENDQPKILIAGVGNELRQDDAFGVLLAQRLQQENILTIFGKSDGNWFRRHSFGAAVI